jgi:hypothetical protein
VALVSREPEGVGFDGADGPQLSESVTEYQLVHVLRFEEDTNAELSENQSVSFSLVTDICAGAISYRNSPQFEHSTVISQILSLLSVRRCSLALHSKGSYFSEPLHRSGQSPIWRIE